MENSALRKTFALFLFSLRSCYSEGPQENGILFVGMEVEEQGAEYLYVSSYRVLSVLDAVTLYLRLSV